MKIIYLHQYFNTPQMRGGTRSYEMARRIVAAGHEVHMVTSWREKSDRSGWFETTVDGIRVHWLAVPYSNHMGFIARIFAFFRFAVFSARKAASLGGDVVFATSTPLTIALPAVYAARRNRIPMVFEVRDLWPDVPVAMGAIRNPVLKFLARRLERFAYRNAKRVVALSPGMKQGVLNTGYSDSHVAVIPNSADLDMFYPGVEGGQAFRASLQALGNRRLVVYTGAFGRVNGLSYMVRMAKAAKDHGLDLFFLALGDGGEKELITRLADELDVNGTYFQILPPVPKVSVPAVLEAADVACSFVIDLEPLWANSANKFFDALASGRPVAINYGGWQAELLTRTGAGLVLPPDDPESAACSVAELFSDEARSEAAGKAARQLAESDFSRDKLAAQLEQVLRDACSADC